MSKALESGIMWVPIVPHLWCYTALAPWTTRQMEQTVFAELEHSPLDDVWVALDLETTGLSPQKDEIIEIGAVKFQERRVLETYQSFVNPRRRLNDFIRGLTGITQADVDQAPSFSALGGALASFIGLAPIVGHNISFDLAFLAQSGLKLSNPTCDTWEMAFVLYPTLREYSLEKLASSLNVRRSRAHRAVDDCLATKEVFLRLLAKLSKLDVYTTAEMGRVAARSSWGLSYLLGRLEGSRLGGRGAGLRSPTVEDASVQATGLDVEALTRRLKQPRPLRPSRQSASLDVEHVASLLEEGGPLSRTLPGFEQRPEQVDMARSVAEAINEGGRLVVEAGTGVGKSLAYLLPAAIYALTNNRRVVISTNTINLQDQLLTKDVPLLVRALAGVDGIPSQELKFCQLKGRANYLCLRRWGHLRSTEVLSDGEARLLAKTLTWLGDTETGDRGEMNLGSWRSAAPWDRLSAQGAAECPRPTEPCFLRAAREKAAASHLVIVNHALLLSDLTAGGSALPDYDVLIVDEAHHLEEEATKHLGFDVGRSGFDDYLQALGGDRGLCDEAVMAFRGSSAAATRSRSVEEVAAGATRLVPVVRDNVAKLFAILEGIVWGPKEGASGPGDDTRITSATRAQPGWSELEIQWHNVDVSLSELDGSLRTLEVSLEGLEEAGLINYEGLMMELANTQQVGADLRQRLAELVVRPAEDAIYWVTRVGMRQDPVMHAAPLHVGETLDKTLYSRKECVIMTSATLSANGTFNHLCERTGFEDARELLLGSPFDYPNAALLCIPEDMPEPSSWAYQAALEQAVSDAALAVGGQTMALFTSHASLRAVAGAIRGDLQARGLTVLAQGVDGTPRQLVRRFLDDPHSVLLGTASFWEGVDLAGESLRVLLVARLPFNVPTEPVFEARSELYEDPFNSYSVPQAVLRLRQGFGRLIRTKTDRGAAVVLDRRIVSRRYGKVFLDSLPPVTIRTCGLPDLANEIRGWVGA